MSDGGHDPAEQAVRSAEVTLVAEPDAELLPAPALPNARLTAEERYPPHR
ncbi:hypothetical protein [Salinifilum ghardaiensis]